MNARHLHRELRQELKRRAKPSHHRDGFDVAHYLGTTHTVLSVRNSDLKDMARTFAHTHKTITPKTLITLITAMFASDTREEKVLAARILDRFPDIRNRCTAAQIDRFMGALSGWEEVDTFSPVVDQWVRHEPNRRTALLTKWNTAKQIEKRRASLVVLVSSVRYDAGETWQRLALTYIGKLSNEKHVMITKAISWLLRAMIKHHARTVRDYVIQNRKTLPAIAVREVTKKLETGKK